MMGFFEIGSCDLFASASYELRSSWSLPSESPGLQGWATTPSCVGYFYLFIFIFLMWWLLLRQDLDLCPSQSEPQSYLCFPMSWQVLVATPSHCSGWGLKNFLLGLVSTSHIARITGLTHPVQPITYYY
jgi:hypothetical protein